MGVADATFYRWKKVYAGMGVAEIRRLKQLEEENAKLKRLVSDLTLDKSMLQDALRKGGKACCSSRGRPALPGCLRIIGAVGLRRDGLWARVSPLPGAARSGIGTEDTIGRLGESRVRYGYRRLHILLRREGWPVNYKRFTVKKGCHSVRAA